MTVVSICTHAQPCFNQTAKGNLLAGGLTDNYAYDTIYQLTQVAQAGPTTIESVIGIEDPDAYYQNVYGHFLPAKKTCWSCKRR